MGTAVLVVGGGTFVWTGLGEGAYDTFFTLVCVATDFFRFLDVLDCCLRTPLGLRRLPHRVTALAI